MSVGHVIRVHQDLNALDAAAWDALLAAQAQPTPFMRLDYLRALHDSGSAVPETGWTPRFVTIERDGCLVGAAPAYLKTHSWGEYVFDFAWADAYRRHRLRYYPKLLVAVPFTPAAGSRLLASDADTRRLLAAALRAVAEQQQLSSIHLLFHDAADAAAVNADGWLHRAGVQFHWQQPEGATWPDFAAFLASLQRDKRKKIAQERRKVADAGVAFTVHHGNDIDRPLWDFFFDCYQRTYAAHHARPYLSRDFFTQAAARLAAHWVMFVARRGGQPLAASLVAVDLANGNAWGRYWGSTEALPCLHFEACYYQPLAWCIAQGVRRFEGGAQGEHKLARGLLPSATTSSHWLAHPEFSRAVDDFLADERADLAGHVNELHERSPFKRQI